MAQDHLRGLGDVLAAWVVAHEAGRNDLARACWKHLAPQRQSRRQREGFERRCFELAAKHQAWTTWHHLMDRKRPVRLRELAHLFTALQSLVFTHLDQPMEAAEQARVASMVRRAMPADYTGYRPVVLAVSWLTNHPDLTHQVAALPPVTIDCSRTPTVAHLLAFHRGRSDWFAQIQAVAPLAPDAIAEAFPLILRGGHGAMVRDLLGVEAWRAAHQGSLSSVSNAWTVLAGAPAALRDELFPLLVPARDWEELFQRDLSSVRLAATASAREGALHRLNRLAQQVDPRVRARWNEAHPTVLERSTAWDRERAASTQPHPAPSGRARRRV